MNKLPPITKNLLIINVLCWMGTMALSKYGIDLHKLLGLHFFLAPSFRIWQLITYMFLHEGFQHIFFNMFAVWMFGRIIEQTMGRNRFLFYYLTCGLGAGLMQEIVQMAEYWYYGYAAYEQANLGGVLVPMADYLNRWNTVGASGAVYGILLAFGVTFPNERLFIFPIPVPIKAKYFVVGYAIIELLSALSQSSDGVAHMAHLGGMLVGLLLIIYWRRGGGNGSNGGYRSYGPRDDSWNGFRNWFSSLFKKKEPHIDVTYGGRYGQEAAYRQQKKEQEEELNRILDKVKKNGYEGLTAEEKRRLFDITRK